MWPPIDIHWIGPSLLRGYPIRATIPNLLNEPLAKIATAYSSHLQMIGRTAWFSTNVGGGFHHAILDGISLGRHNTVWCGHHITLVGIRICQHGAILCGHHAPLVGMIQGWHDIVLCGHHALFFGMILDGHWWNKDMLTWRCPMWTPCSTYLNDPRLSWYCPMWPPCLILWNDPR